MPSASVVQFVLFSRFVYRSRPGRAQALAYPLLHLLIAGFGSAALWLIVRVSGWPSSWAGLAAIAAQVPVAFLLTRWWFNSATAPQLAWRWFERAGVVALVGGAAVFVGTGLLALYHLGFRRPMWDQYRSYQLLLEAPFPGNVLQSENGHRPIFPNLLKLLDLSVDGGRQGVLVFCGGLFALLVFALCAMDALARARAAAPVARGRRAGAALAAVLARQCTDAAARQRIGGGVLGARLARLRTDRAGAQRPRAGARSGWRRSVWRWAVSVSAMVR